MSLLCGLAQIGNGELRDEGTLEQPLEVVVAHVNHQIREDSGSDAEWVCSLAGKLELRCRIECVDVPGRVAETQESLEEAARVSRYEMLGRIALEERCDAIAVAHTADDQAETVLHHLIRGTSVTGLRGMLWTRPTDSASATTSVPLIRPMLDIRRAEIEAWLQETGQDYRTDPTNTDKSLTRNRIRHQLLPLLEQEFNPQIRKVLGTLSSQAAEISDLLKTLADNLADTAIVQLAENSIRINCPDLADQPPVLVRETMLTIWQRAAWPLKRMGHREWQKLYELVDQNSGAVSLPEKVHAQRRGQLLVLSRDSGSVDDPAISQRST